MLEILMEGIFKTVQRQFRHKIEETAEEIDPILGSCVRVSNNIGDSIDNVEDSLLYGTQRKLFAWGEDNFEVADHLFVQRVGYTHHGIYIGKGKVIHYSDYGIEKVSLEEFSDGDTIHKKSELESPISHSKEKCVKRAKSRVGEKDYNLVWNNCENFVRWCRNGPS